MNDAIQPFFSVVTVCYNSAKTIADTMDSLLKQTFKRFEYIVIDGLSTDGTIEIVKSYKNRFEEAGIAVKFVSESDLGIYDAMNKGILMAEGQLVGIINSDDWYEDDALQKVYESTKNVKNVLDTIFYGFIKLWKEEKEYCIRRYHHNFVNENVIQHPTCFIPLHLYRKYGLYDKKYKICGDYDLLNRFMKADVVFKPLDVVISNFRIGGASSKWGRVALKERLDIQYIHGYIDSKVYKREMMKIRIKVFFVS